LLQLHANHAFAEITLLKDPLRVMPKEIAGGALLPGDSSAAPCPVQKDFAKPLGLGDAVDLALCNNAQIRAAWANIKVQAAASGEAWAAFLPTLSGTVSRINDQTRYPGVGANPVVVESRSAYASLSWRLLDFGGREANLRATQHGLAAALASHDAILQSTLAEVIQAYFDAKSAKAAWQAKEQDEAIARSILDTARRREARGASTHSETLQAATALAKASLENNRMQGTYQKALSVLVFTMGVPTQTAVILSADDVEALPLSAMRDLNTWLNEAEERHPAIKAARAQLEAARYRVTAIRSEGLPTLDFSTNYFENGRPGQSLTPRTRERTVGLVLTIPFFDGFSRNYKTRGGEAQVEQRGAELQDTEHRILMEVVKAHADARTALANLHASENLLSAARESLEVSKRKYESGAADILEILSTQGALADAQLERIRCQTDWRAARLRLLASAGAMGRFAVAP
jgi:outer membrane protein